MALPEVVAPISVDLRQEDNRLNIVKGIEFLKIKDEPMTAGVVSGGCTAGDWLVYGAGGLAYPTATAVANTYPVWVGNDQYDAQATGNATILVGGGFIYRTIKYVTGSYVAGQNLTVKDLGGGEHVPSAAGGSDPVLARVFTAPDANGIMEILVLDR
jgi:hypothetical protein